MASGHRRLVDLDVVVLAAGRSSRMGEPKGLVTVEGRPWIEHQLDALDGIVAAGGRAIVVLGFGRDLYEARLPRLSSRAAVVVNDAPERGAFSSLQCGLSAASKARGGRLAAVLPVDVPAASPPTWSALAEAAEQPGVQAAVPVHGGRGGHPVVLTAAFVGALLARPPGSRLDREIGRLAEGGVGGVVRVPVGDARVGLNLNAPEDWGKLKAIGG